MTKDVPENAVMIGIPAKNINTKSELDTALSNLMVSIMIKLKNKNEKYTK